MSENMVATHKYLYTRQPKVSLVTCVRLVAASAGVYYVASRHFPARGMVFVTLQQLHYRYLPQFH